MSSRRCRAALAVAALTVPACSGATSPSGPSPSGPTGQVTGDVVVFAAASLSGAFTELGDEFVADHPDATVTFDFSGSSELARQILEGAPVDVYASADLDNMAKLTAAGATVGDPVVFAANSAEIVVAPGNPLAVTGLADLIDPDLIVVTCAPEVPCGHYASEVFERAGLVVTPDSLERSVQAVVTKVALGEADAGIAYATDVLAAGGRITGVPIPADVNVVADYPIARLTEAPNPTGSAAFVEFVLSEAGQAILTSWGFAAP